MGIHHHTDFVCPGCDEYVGDNMKYCSQCEGEYCEDCYSTEYKYFKKFKKDENSDNEKETKNDTNEEKDLYYYEHSEDYIECKEDDLESQEDDEDNFVEVSYILCNKCEKKNNNFCECCLLYDTLNSNRCQCGKNICDNCKVTNKNKKTCWLCIQNSNKFKKWLQKELNCSLMADIIAKYKNI
jgi:hypothetical protein